MKKLTKSEVGWRRDILKSDTTKNQGFMNLTFYYYDFSDDLKC